MGQTTNHPVMERLFILTVICYLCGSVVELSGQAVESPQYRVVHSESDFEVRLYRESSWMSAQVLETTSFEKATKDGFHRLYQYVHGDNLNSSQITITAPVLTSIIPSVHGQEYYVRLYLPAKYERTPPQPFPELNLQFDKRRSRCIAARKFPGFAKDDDINEELDTCEQPKQALEWKTRNTEREERLCNRPIQCFTSCFWALERSVDGSLRINYRLLRDACNTRNKDNVLDFLWCNSSGVMDLSIIS